MVVSMEEAEHDIEWLFYSNTVLSRRIVTIPLTVNSGDQLVEQFP